jgi:hypothetical protein
VGQRSRLTFSTPAPPWRGYRRPSPGRPDLSKSRGEEILRRFTFDGRSIEVVEVLDAWLAPDHRYFKVRGDDGAYYILRNDVMTGRWELTMFDRTGAIRRKR